MRKARQGLAADVVQEAVLIVLHHPDQYRGEATVRAWLLGVTANVARRLLRTEGRRQQHEQARALAPSRRAETDPVVAAQAHELRALVEALPEDQQLPLVLHYFHGLNYDEVASVLACPAGTVASRIHRGRRRLRGQLLASGVLTATAEVALGAATPAFDVPPALATRRRSGPGRNV